MARGSPWRQSQTNHVRVLDEGRVRRVLIPRSGMLDWQDPATVGPSLGRSTMTSPCGKNHAVQSGLEKGEAER